MNFLKMSQSFKMSIKSIMGNKGRSALTTLGIIIGVASVIILTGLGNGATSSITDELSSMGTKLITVSMSRGGWGVFEVAARYSALDLDSRTVRGGGEQDVTLGLNWYPTDRLRLAALQVEREGRSCAEAVAAVDVRLAIVFQEAEIADPLDLRMVGEEGAHLGGILAGAAHAQLQRL